MENILPNDPLFSQQWHLNNTGQSGGTVGADINILDAWSVATGNGVVIGIVDGGVDFTHPDLRDKYLAGLSFDFADGDSDPSPNSQTTETIETTETSGGTETTETSETIETPGRTETTQRTQTRQTTQTTRRTQTRTSNLPNDDHGTPVTGIAVASGNNETGITGVAYDASFAGLRIQFDGELAANELDLQIANTLSHKNQDIDIYNNSWLIPEPLIPFGESTGSAIEKSINEGRDGLGNIHIFAAGNLAELGGNVNYYPFTNSRYTIAVGALDHNGARINISNPGASLLISTYAESDDEEGIITTDITGDNGLSAAQRALAASDISTDNNYTNFAGTSAAAPIVSGVVALMLEVNPDLTWRDVQHILVKTAAQNDPDNSDWMENGAGYLVNHNYGFGEVDATAAVTAAQNWENVAPEIFVDSEVLNINTNIPDNDTQGIISEIDIEDNLNLEWVEVTTDADLVKEDLTIILTSPDGTDSILSPGDTDGATEGDWTFTSARHWGESSAGQWRLTIIDNEESDSETKWDSWKLKFYGTAKTDNEVYRFFNNASAVHFYTSNETERDSLQENPDNFRYEGVSYRTVDPVSGNENIAPVYRFLNQDTKVHVYTIDENERDSLQKNPDNFSFEGEVFSAYTSQVEGSIPVYRFLNVASGAHFYTPSATEKDAVENLPNYNFEEVAYYALPVE